MVLQFEHNNFFRNELKEQRGFMSYMNKELDDMSKEFDGIRSQIARLQKLTAEISDMQATLVNKMAAKPDSYENQDEDLKVIDVSPIKSSFCNMNLDETEYDQPLPRRCPNDSKFLDLDAKIDKSGIEEVKTLHSNEPTILYSRNLKL